MSADTVCAQTRKRRKHSKSRKGCVGCKRRHHKCDEAHPTCAACNRLGEDCHYIDGEPQPHARTSTGLTSSPKAQSRSHREAQPLPVETSLKSPYDVPTPYSQASCTSTESAASQPTSFLDLELMADFLMRGLVDIYPACEAASLLQQKFIDLALTRPYLLHGILSVSALRMLAVDSSRQELRTRASFHQAEALHMAQPYVASITEEHSVPLLFFSSLATVSSLAEVGIDDLGGIGPDFDPIDKILHTFQMTRGILTLLSPFWSYIRQAWAWEIINNQIHTGSDLVPRPHDVPAYTRLRALAFGTEGPDVRQACLQAAQLTLDYISLVQQRNDVALSIRLSTSWPFEVDGLFHTLLAERKPVPLVILAHYAALLHLGTGLWWVGKWPVICLQHVECVLGAEWKEFLAWPRDIIFGVSGSDSTKAST